MNFLSFYRNFEDPNGRWSLCILSEPALRWFAAGSRMNFYSTEPQGASAELDLAVAKFLTPQGNEWLNVEQHVVSSEACVQRAIVTP